MSRIVDYCGACSKPVRDDAPHVCAKVRPLVAPRPAFAPDLARMQAMEAVIMAPPPPVPVIITAAPEPLDLARIRTNGGTQVRAGTDEPRVEEYREAMAAGATFPPVVVFYDGDEYWLADGFHRVAAALAAGLEGIAADVRPGTRRDAILFAVGANASHGLPRSNADKRRAVETLLRDEEWGARSDHWIADAAAVSQPFVSKVRGELRAAGDNGYHPPKATTGKDGKERPAAKPCAEKAPPAAKPERPAAQPSPAAALADAAEAEQDDDEPPEPAPRSLAAAIDSMRRDGVNRAPDERRAWQEALQAEWDRTEERIGRNDP